MIHKKRFRLVVRGKGFPKGKCLEIQKERLKSYLGKVTQSQGWEEVGTWNLEIRIYSVPAFSMKL